MTREQFEAAQDLCAEHRAMRSATADLEDRWETYKRLMAPTLGDLESLAAEMVLVARAQDARIATLEADLGAEKRSVDTLSRLMAALVPAVREIERKLGLDSQFAPEPPIADMVDVGAALHPVPSGFEEPPTAQIIDLMAALRKAIR